MSKTRKEVRDHSSVDGEASKGELLSNIVVSQNDQIFAKMTYTLIGVTQLLIWNSVINFAVPITAVWWPGTISLDVLGGPEHAAALLVSIAMLKGNSLDAKRCHWWGGLNCILFFIFPLIPQFFDGKNNTTVAYILLTVISVFMGFSVGFLHTYGYAFASIMPTDCTGYLSLGNGFAGVWAFVIYIFFSQVVFSSDVFGLKKLCWVFFCLSGLVGVLQFVCFLQLSKKEWFQECKRLAMQKKETDIELTLKAWGPRRSFILIFGDCYPYAIIMGISMFTTLALFPSIGPLKWPYESFLLQTLFQGTFQVIDLFVRWLPLLGGWTRIPKQYIWIGCVLRPIVLIPLFMIPYKFPNVAFFSSLGWLFVLMAVFTITNGWFFTLTAIYCSESVEHPGEKEVCSDIYVIILLFSVTVGIYFHHLLEI